MPRKPRRNANGLGLVSNANGTATAGSSALYCLTGKVVGGTVELFATNYTLSDLNKTYLYGISDSLSATQASQVTAEQFSTLATAPTDSNFKGVSFAPTSPVPEASTLSMLLAGIALTGFYAVNSRRRRRTCRPIVETAARAH